jgi:hypothetical protein
MGPRKFEALLPMSESETVREEGNSRGLQNHPSGGQGGDSRCGESMGALSFDAREVGRRERMRTRR